MRFFEEVFNDQPWMSNSKCGNDQALKKWQIEHRETNFFDEKGPYVKEAKKYCIGCPAFDDCHDYAMSQTTIPGDPLYRNENLFDGIYAGTTGRERRALKKKAKKAALAFLATLQDKAAS